jgi:hypothetical protein
MPAAAGVHQGDGDLGVLDPPGGAGVLALHPNRCRPLLEVAGLVHHQHRLRVAQVLDHVVAAVIAHLVVIPHRPGQQVLHPVRVGVAGVLGDRPAVLAWQLRQQAAHERPGPPPKVRPSEPTRDPAQQLVEQLLPAGGVDVYAVACGHRLMFGPHNTRSSAVAALVYSAAGPRRAP